MLCVHLEGWDREGGREMQQGGDMGIYVYIQLIHFVIQQKLTTLLSNYIPIRCKNFKKLQKKKYSQIKLAKYLWPHISPPPFEFYYTP